MSMTAISSRTLMRRLLLVQALAALAIGAAAWHWLGASPGLAVVLGLAAVALARLLINANNFVMSARRGSPTPPAFRLGPRARLQMLVEEFCASMATTSWHMPRARAHLRIHPGCSTPPVLLLHGYGCNSGYWVHLTALLDAAGISHATLDLEPLTGDIDDYADGIECGAQELLQRSGAGQIVIVSHSMGGLAARAWMRRHGSARLARLITLGTPHHGTCMAALGIGINADQMRRAGVAGPACAWLTALAASEDGATRARITSIYSHHDNIVSPQTSSELDGARNLAFGGVGHVALGRNRRVLAAVMADIRHAAASCEDAAAVHHRSC